MKLALIIDNAEMAANVGGAVHTRVKLFDMPKDVEQEIASLLTEKYINFSISFVDEAKK